VPAIKVINVKVAHNKDKAVVAKHSPREDTSTSSSNGGKASASEDQATMAAKHSPRSGPARSRQQIIYQRGDQRANNGKASTKGSIKGQ